MTSSLSDLQDRLAKDWVIVAQDQEVPVGAEVDTVQRNSRYCSKESEIELKQCTESV